MKFDNLIKLVGKMPYFDLQTLLCLVKEEKTQLLTQLYQWSQRGLIISLKRGWYALSDSYRQGSLSPLVLANQLYHPSYLSTYWALSYYGVIPEKVTRYTSVTTRVTRSFENHFGLFVYSSIKKKLFWGFESKKIGGENIWIAFPEKALLDLLYLEAGEWTKERFIEMRFDWSLIDFIKLKEFSKKTESARLKKAMEQMVSLSSAEDKGWRVV